MGSRSLERSDHRVDRLRRARPRPLRSGPGARRLRLRATCVADLVGVLDERGIDRRRAGRRLDGRAHDPAARARAPRARRRPGAHHALLRPGRVRRRRRARALGLARRGPAHRRGRGLRRGLRRPGRARGLARDDAAGHPPAARRATSTPRRSPTRCSPCRARGRSARSTTSGRSRVPTVVVADRDEADPGHPLAVGEAYAEAIPGARLVVEEEGKSPIAWQGGQLSKVIAELSDEVFSGRRASRRRRAGYGAPLPKKLGFKPGVTAALRQPAAVLRRAARRARRRRRRPQPAARPARPDRLLRDRRGASSSGGCPRCGARSRPRGCCGWRGRSGRRGCRPT